MVKGMAKGGCQKLNVPYAFSHFTIFAKINSTFWAAVQYQSSSSTQRRRPATNNYLRPYILPVCIYILRRRDFTSLYDATAARKDTTIIFLSISIILSSFSGVIVFGHFIRSVIGNTSKSTSSAPYTTSYGMHLMAGRHWRKFAIIIITQYPSHQNSIAAKI